MKIIPANKRYFSNMGWLKSYHLFSFANYIDYNNMDWGVLRVFNDDYIDAHSWFPMHPHSNMEIITIMLDWELTHTDSMGNNEVLNNEWIQITSAGNWIYHSEMNNSDKPVHLYQIWIQPNKIGKIPSYANVRIDPSNYNNQIYPLVSWEGKSKNIIDANWTLYRCKLELGKSINFTTTQQRFIFIYVYKWSLLVNWNLINENCQLREFDIKTFEILAQENSEFILIDTFM